MPRAIQTFEVSLKAFIVRDGHVLLVREADTGYWELPGGRIDVGEEWREHAAILNREIAEELGAAIVLRQTDQIVTWVRQRPTDHVFQFLAVRLCHLTAGEPALSDEHATFAWHTPATWSSLVFPPLSGYRDGLDRLWSLTHIV